MAPPADLPPANLPPADLPPADLPPAGRLFCFGLGFCALALADRLLAAGWQVAGTVRQADKAAALAARGIAATAFERGAPVGAGLSDRLAGASHVLVSVPPDEQGDPVLDGFGPALAGRSDLAWLGYLSTTGVYGDRGGDWVDEDSPRQPTGVRGRRRVDAEDRWLALGRQHGVPVHLFRLAGIYGPGRSPLEALRAGTARRIDRPGHLFSRVHVDDIAAVLAASMARPNPGRAYNVCDDEPATPADVVAHAAGLLGMPAPPLVPFEAAGLSAMAASFWADSKRVRNRRIKDELGVRLRYPDYRSGLGALI